MINRVASSLLVLALILAGCSMLGSTAGAVPDDQMILSISNATDRQVALLVNGTKVADVGARSGQDIKAGQRPALPWNAEVRLPTGRLLLQLTVRSGSVVRTANGGSSTGARVDLSCGRIDLWSGYPMLGPVPGPGLPGDCNP